MQSIFRYLGGKSRRTIRDWILSHRPVGVSEFREPCVGGGGVFFGSEGFRRRWVNDLNPGLVAVYLTLRDRPGEFIAACRTVPTPMTAAAFTRIVGDTNADLPLRWFVANRCSYGGMVNFTHRCRMRLNDPNGWNITRGTRLDLAGEFLQGVKVTCGDFAPLLAEPGKAVWCYIDPPYLTARTWPAAQPYEFMFSREDHIRLADAVRRSPHFVAISLNDDQDGFVRSLYRTPEFRIIEGGWYYSGSQASVKRQARELLILNYAPPRTATVLQAPKRDAVPRGRPISSTDQAKRDRLLQLLSGPQRLSVNELRKRAGCSWHLADLVMKQQAAASGRHS